MGQKFGAFACALIALSAVSLCSIAEEPAANDAFGRGGPAPAAGRGAPPDEAPVVAADQTQERRWSMATGDAEEMAAQARIESVLHGPLKSSFDFSEAPLNAITAQIAQEYDIPIVFDTTALDAIATAPETEVSVRIANVTLRTALDLMMRGVEDLTYIVDNEVLLITTQEEANKRLETRIYRIDDFVSDSALRGASGRASSDSLIDLVVMNVARDSWSVSGTGEGEIMSITPGLLVISQTSRVQRQVEELLASLRAMKREILADPATDVAAAGVKPVTRGFTVIDETLAASEESRSALRQALEASVPWNTEGEFEKDDVFIHVLPKRVLVRHLPDVVDQVEQALQDMKVTNANMQRRASRGAGFGGRPQPQRREGGF